MEEYWLKILGIGIFLSGTVIAFSIGFCLLFKAIQSRRWPHVIGRVTHRELDVQYDDGYSYKPVVVVEYEVGGEAYRSEKVMIGDYWGTKKRGQRIIKKYKKGSGVPVFYNPKKHDDAVLEPGVHFGVIHIMFFFGIVFGGTSCLILYATLNS